MLAAEKESGYILIPEREIDNHMKPLRYLLPALLLLSASLQPASAAPMPQLVHQGEKYSLLVDGKPYIVLGAQVENSSAWPARFDSLLPGATALGINTIEAPAYWDDIEPTEGHFNFANYDHILQSARAHNFHLVLLWFGTWKNGTMDYAPTWVKSDTTRFPHMLDPGRQPVRVLTPLSDNNLNADRTAFAALMKHLKEVDGDQHTVIMVQVENESGSLFTDRDHSIEADAKFNGPVPAAVLKALDKKPGTWPEVFGAAADETFAAYYVSRYVNAVAEAGKKEFPLPFYANVWLRETKNFMRPGEAYPSGGGTLNMLNLWKAMTPSIDAVAPDNYVLDYVNYNAVLSGYHRKDNPMLVPETGGPRFASNIFYALGDHDSLGYAFFGLDDAIEGDKVRELAQMYSDDVHLLTPAIPFIASMQGTGKLHSAVEEQYLYDRLIQSSQFDVLVQFGTPHPEYGGTFGTQTPHQSGRALVAELAPDEFLIIGFDARIDFRPSPGRKQHNAQFLSAEEGTFIDGQWKASRQLNGDETFFGFRLPAKGTMVRVKLTAY